jgi:hypothetical protein
MTVAAKLSIRLSDDLRRRLKAVSHRMHRNSSEIARMALEEFLDAQQERRTAPSHRVRDLIGSLDSEIPELASRHQTYVLKSVRGR